MGNRPQCTHCGCDYEPLRGDGTLANPHECDSCWTHFAERAWNDFEGAEEITREYLDHRRQEVVDARREMR